MRHLPDACAPLLGLLALTLAACQSQVQATVTPARPVAARATLTLPTQVHLPMPISLEAVMGGDKAAPLVASGGGNLVASGGGNLVASGGGNLVASGGGNLTPSSGGIFGLLDASASASASPAADPCSASGQAYFSEIMSLALTPYAEAVLIVNGVLARAAASGLTPDSSRVIDDPRGNGGKLCVTLTKTPLGGLLRASRGTPYQDSQEILALAFKTPTHGVAVYRSEDLHPTLGHLALAITFDLDNQQVDADGVADPSVLPAAQDRTLYRAHWTFTAPKNPAPGAPGFTMRLAGFNHDPTYPCMSGPRAVAANFIASGAASVRMGRVLAGQQALSFTRYDGHGYDATASGADNFYLGLDGQPLAPAAASPALAAIAPTPDSFLPSYPADPGTGAPFAAPVFAFPDERTLLP